MKKLLNILICLSILITACEESTEDEDSPTNQPTNTNNTTTASPNQVAEAIVFPVGTQKVDGDLPAASSATDAPILSSNGSEFQLTFKNQNTLSGSLSGTFNNLTKGKILEMNVKIDGADHYYKVPATTQVLGLDSMSGGVSFSFELAAGITTKDVGISYNINDRNKNGNHSETFTGILKQPIRAIASDYIEFENSDLPRISGPLQYDCGSHPAGSWRSLKYIDDEEWNLGLTFSTSENCSSRNTGTYYATEYSPMGTSEGRVVIRLGRTKYTSSDTTYYSYNGYMFSNDASFTSSIENDKLVYKAEKITLIDQYNSSSDTLVANFVLTKP